MDRLQEIEQRLDGLEDKDWEWDGREEEDDGFIYHPQGSYLGQTLICLGDTYEDDHLDLDFIARAPRDMEYLLSELKRVRARLAEVVADHVII